MRMLFMAIAIASLLASPEAHARRLKGFKIGNWSAGAYSNDATNKFSHCAGLAPYKNGVNLLFTVDRNYQWAVGFASDSFNLSPGQSIQLALAMDGGTPTRVNAYAISRDMVRVNLSPTAELFNRFRTGGQLTLFGNDKSFTFNLTDTSKLLPSLVSCVNAALAPPKMQAVVAPPRNSHSDSGKADNRAEATAIVANVLSQAGVTGFRLEPAPQSDSSSIVEVAWTSPSASGALIILAADDQVKSPSDTTPILIAISAKACKGQFMSGALPEEANGTQSRVFTSCKSGQTNRTTYYLTISRKAGGHYVFSTTSDGNALEDPAKDADAHIRNVAYKLLPK